ncbi:MAG: hypothetical protein ACK5U5_02285, partial [Burkholderiales bacterium]
VHDIMGVGVFLMIFSAVIFFAPTAGGFFLEYNNFIPADPLKTPAHIAPVWYFTPYYSILRATTSAFIPWLWLFLAVTAGLVYFNSNISRPAKLLVVGLAGALFMLMGIPGIVLNMIGLESIAKLSISGVQILLGIDAKFWGVVLMGAAVLILFSLPWIDQSPVRSIRYRPGWHKWLYGIFFVNFFVLGYLGILPPSPVGSVVSEIGTVIYFGFFLLMPWWSRMGEFKPVPERVTFEAH